MPWEFDSKAPIFKQIMDNITFKIIKGDYKAGEKLDSVRDLALEAGVNPNTMQRAMSEIETTGLIETKRGDGRYITENEEIIKTLRRKYIEENTVSFLEKMQNLGFSKSDLLEIIEKTEI